MAREARQKQGQTVQQEQDQEEQTKTPGQKTRQQESLRRNHEKSATSQEYHPDTGPPERQRKTEGKKEQSQNHAAETKDQQQAPN